MSREADNDWQCGHVDLPELVVPPALERTVVEHRTAVDRPRIDLGESLSNRCSRGSRDLAFPIFTPARERPVCRDRARVGRAYRDAGVVGAGHSP